MTSQARKQAWAAAHELVGWECAATHAVWRFLNPTGREIIIHLMVPRAYGISSRSRCVARHRYPELGGIARPLLKIVPPDQYARAIAMQLSNSQPRFGP